MKAADTKIIKGVKEFLSDILPDVKDSPIDFGFGTGNVLKGKNQEKISFSFNITVASDNFPGILDEEEYLKKVKKGLSKRIGKEIRYLRVDWTFQDNVAVKSEDPCCISFEVKLA